MTRLGTVGVTGLLVLAIVGPALANFWLSAGNRRDASLVKQYECLPTNTYRPFPVSRSCPDTDFTGDGKPETLSVVEVGKQRRIQMLSRDQIVLSLPYDYIDNTWRTHLAIYDGDRDPHLLVYDGTDHRKKPFKAVFAWVDGAMREVTSSDLETEILVAMARHDDSGGFHEMLIKTWLRRVLLALWYLLLLCLLVVSVRRFRRRTRDV